MNTKLLLSIIIVGFFGASAVTQADRPRRGDMLEKSVRACINKTPGDDCSFSIRSMNPAGKCVALSDAATVCAPNHLTKEVETIQAKLKTEIE